MEANIADKTVRYKVIDGFSALWRFKLENLIRSDNTVATDQIIQYPPVSDDSRYTFSLWAFPEETYPSVLPLYFAFCKKYYQRQGLSQQHVVCGVSHYERPAVAALLFVGRQRNDHRPGVHGESRLDHIPRRPTTSSAATTAAFRCRIRLRMVTRAQIEKALGDRWKQFADARRTFDPNNRLLNEYFRDMLERSGSKLEIRHAIHTVGTAHEYSTTS